MPNSDKRNLEEKVLKTFAMFVSEQKLPIQDIMMKHAESAASNRIRISTFATSVVEDELKLGGKLTKNMVKVLCGRFDDGLDDTLSIA